MHADSSNHIKAGDTVFFILKGHAEYSDVKKAIKIKKATNVMKFSLTKKSDKNLKLTVNANTGETCVESLVTVKTNASRF